MKLWYSIGGTWVRDDKAAIPITDIGFQRGYGAVDVLCAYHKMPYRLEDHLERLERSLELLRIKAPARASIERIIKQGIKKNELIDAVIKIYVTGGHAAPGPLAKGKPLVVVTFAPYEPWPRKFYEEGAAVIPVSLQRILPEAKSLSYVPSVLAAMQAQEKGAHEGVFMDARGRITEGATSNIFMVRNGILYTPKRGVLPGITRQRVIALAKKILPVQEIEYLLDTDLKGADEIFITSVNRGVMPVTSYAGKMVNGGVVGEWTVRLMEAYRDDIDRTCR